MFKFEPNNNKQFKIKNPSKSKASKYDKKAELKSRLEENKKILETLLHFPENSDLKFRYFSTMINNKTYNSLIIFYDGLINSEIIDGYILRQLMKDTSIDEKTSLHDVILGSKLPQNQVSVVNNYEEVINGILVGNCAVFIDTLNIAFICDTKKIPQRSISKSENEMSVKGPAEAFIEILRANTGLIRKFVRDENLVFEEFKVGVRRSNCM